MLTSIIHAALASLAIIRHPARLAKAPLIISDAGRWPAPPPDDLHDLTGHHRYYGRSAWIDSRMLVA